MSLKHRKLPMWDRDDLVVDIEDLLAELRATLAGAPVTPLMQLFRGYLD